MTEQYIRLLQWFRNKPKNLSKLQQYTLLYVMYLKTLDYLPAVMIKGNVQCFATNDMNTLALFKQILLFVLRLYET